MKRDIDLVRLILISAENSEKEFNALSLVSSDLAAEKICFHVELLEQAGLLTAKTTRAYGGTPVLVEVNALTWIGYDYLDAIRSETVWQKAKTAIQNTVKDAPLSVIKEVCISISTSLIKSNLGL